MKKWTQDECAVLCKYFKKMTHEEIGTMLCRNESQVRAKCHDMGLVKKKQWTENEICFLNEYYNKMSVNQIAKILCRTVSSVRLKMKRLSLHKDMYRSEEQTSEL